MSKYVQGPLAPRRRTMLASARLASRTTAARIMTEFQGIKRRRKTNLNRKIVLAEAYKILIDRTNHEVLSLLHKWIKDNGGHPMEAEMIRREKRRGDVMRTTSVSTRRKVATKRPA